MKVNNSGIVVHVQARVVRRSIIMRDPRNNTEAVHKSSVLLLRLQRVDGKKVRNTRAYIYNNQQVEGFHLKEGDLMTFDGVARSDENGFYFISLKNVEVIQEIPKIVGVLKPGQSLKDYVNSMSE